MNPIFFQVLESLRLNTSDVQKHERFRNVEFKNLRIDIKHFFRNLALVMLGALSGSFGLMGFLLPNSFMDGGVTGISLLLSEVSGVNLAFLIVLLNIPFIVLAYSSISKQFAFQSVFAILLLALLIYFIHFPLITKDGLLIAVFGGFFLGLGIGLTIRGGGVLDGTEILAIFLNKKSFMTIGDIILIFNLIIFVAAAVVFTIETALYAVLTYFVASKTVNFVIDGIEEYMGVSIISDENEEIRLAIIEKLGRGCTIYMGKKGFAQRGAELKPVEIVYCVITRLEMTRLKKEVEKIDSDAFITMSRIKDVRGGMIKKRPLSK